MAMSLETPSPSDLHAHLGYWLRMVSNAVSRRFAREVEAEGVTVAEWVFLRAMYDCDAIGPSQLAERMAMTRGAISKLAERLVEKDFVERQPNPDDGRAHTLALKPAGKAIVPRLAALADENDAAFFAELTPAERGQLQQMLERIVRERDLTDIPVN
jgi:DNA-binding MarR family transcriptional regulator